MVTGAICHNNSIVGHFIHVAVLLSKLLCEHLLDTIGRVGVRSHVVHALDSVFKDLMRNRFFECNDMYRFLRELHNSEPCLANANIEKLGELDHKVLDKLPVRVTSVRRVQILD